MEIDMDLSALDNVELANLAREVRKRAQQGDRRAYGPAHQFEKELRRRGIGTATQPGSLSLQADSTLAVVPAAFGKAWWRFWR